MQFNIKSCIFLPLGIILFLSSVVYWIGTSILDIHMIYNKSDLYQNLTQSKLYFHCKLELAMNVAILALIAFSAFFAFNRSDSQLPFLVLFPVPFSCLGVTAAVYTIFIFTDTTESACAVHAKAARDFVDRCDWGTYEGIMIQRQFADAKNSSDLIYNTYTWAKELCHKDYDTRASIVSGGFAGIALSIISPLIFPFYLWYVIWYYCCR